jgi:hypothetical protein
VVAVKGTQPGFNHQGASWPELTPEQADMVAANTGLIGHVIKIMHIPPREHDDRWQDGTLGLIRAVQLYEPERGFTFATYAVYWIRQAVAKGREVEEGAAFRQAKRTDTPYRAPLSLDAQLRPDGFEDDGTATIVLPGPEDTERDAVIRAQLAEVKARLATMHLDRIDRAIADLLVIPSHRKPTAGIDAVLAARFGMHRQAVCRRRERLQAVLRGERPSITYHHRRAVA